jgi:two-component system, chemotaxis family, chemotaxis protein CheY
MSSGGGPRRGPSEPDGPAFPDDVLKPGPHKILVVDDDVDIVDALLDALTDEGYTVAVANDGFEALSYLRSSPAPCLILLDWMMPRCDGPTFREKQRADPALASIPVVLVTADPRVAEKSRELGAVANLRKPIDLDELLRLIAVHC